MRAYGLGRGGAEAEGRMNGIQLRRDDGRDSDPADLHRGRATGQLPCAADPARVLAKDVAKRRN
jgi:hypothetical protein